MAGAVAEGISARCRSGQRAGRERAVSRARLRASVPALAGQRGRLASSSASPPAPAFPAPRPGNLREMPLFLGLRPLLPAHQRRCSRRRAGVRLGHAPLRVPVPSHPSASLGRRGGRWWVGKAAELPSEELPARRASRQAPRSLRGGQAAPNRVPLPLGASLSGAGGSLAAAPLLPFGRTRQQMRLQCASWGIPSDIH